MVVNVADANPVETAKALIDRGVLSGFRVNNASAHLLITSGNPHNSWAEFFPEQGSIQQKKLQINTLQADYIEHKKDIMFYQTGARRINSTIHFHDMVFFVIVL